MDLARRWKLTERQTEAVLAVAYGSARSHVATLLGLSEKYCDELLGAAYEAARVDGHAGLVFRLFGRTPDAPRRPRARRRR